MIFMFDNLVYDNDYYEVVELLLLDDRFKRCNEYHLTIGIASKKV